MTEHHNNPTRLKTARASNWNRSESIIYRLLSTYFRKPTDSLLLVHLWVEFVRTEKGKGWSLHKQSDPTMWVRAWHARYRFTAVNHDGNNHRLFIRGTFCQGGSVLNITSAEVHASYVMTGRIAKDDGGGGSSEEGSQGQEPPPRFLQLQTSAAPAASRSLAITPCRLFSSCSKGRSRSLAHAFISPFRVAEDAFLLAARRFPGIPRLVSGSSLSLCCHCGELINSLVKAWNE